MTIKDSAKVTITLDRTTVAKLRAEKKGMAWNAYMLHLIGGTSQGSRAICMNCGRVLETKNINESPSMLAKENGWQPLYSGRVEVTTGELKRPVELGYVCPSCGGSK